MSQLIPQNFGQVSTRFQGVQVEDDLSSGIQSSFGIIGYKGKVWSIRYRGEEIQLMREDGDGPKSSIEVVLLKSSKHISKVWYENGYVEGSNAAPDCFSNNGIVPEPTSTKKQCDSCALCPHNQWGSRITPAGKAGKACSDSKRVAVTPLGDINNEMFGGPMLLRVPAASLQDLAMYGQKMQQMGYPYFSIGTRIQFDPAESFPKFKISAIRPLSDQEAELVMGLRDNHTVERILSENEFAQSAGGAAQQASQQTPEQVFEQPPQEASKGAGGFGGTVAASNQQTQPDLHEEHQANEIAQKEAAAKKAKAEALAAKKAEMERLEAELAAQQAEPEESDEERELRELEERMAKMKAAAAAKKTQKTEEPKTIEGEVTSQGNAGGFGGAVKKADKPAQQTVQNSEPVGDTGGNMASDFEANLDNMLAELLPG